MIDLKLNVKIIDLKGSVHTNHKNILFHLTLVVSHHTNSFGFMYRSPEISVPETATTFEKLNILFHKQSCYNNNFHRD